MLPVKIAGLGYHLPERRVTSSELLQAWSVPQGPPQQRAPPAGACPPGGGRAWGGRLPPPLRDDRNHGRDGRSRCAPCAG